MDNDISSLADRLSQRDVRVITKIMERMVYWNLTFPRAIANAIVNWDRNPVETDEEFDAFERSLDWWIDAGKRYG